MSEEIRTEKPDSVEVSQNAKGDNAYKVKIYFDDDKVKGEDIVVRVGDIYKKLHEVFK